MTNKEYSKWLNLLDNNLPFDVLVDGEEEVDLHEMIWTLCEKLEQDPKTVSIPEGATNGDAFKIMFNKTFPKTIILYKNDESRLTINPMFSREWWEMPYKESEGNNGD